MLGLLTNQWCLHVSMIGCRHYFATKNPENIQERVKTKLAVVKNLKRLAYAEAANVPDSLKPLGVADEKNKKKIGVKKTTVTPCKDTRDSTKL